MTAAVSKPMRRQSLESYGTRPGAGGDPLRKPQEMAELDLLLSSEYAALWGKQQQQRVRDEANSAAAAAAAAASAREAARDPLLEEALKANPEKRRRKQPHQQPAQGAGGKAGGASEQHVAITPENLMYYLYSARESERLTRATVANTEERERSQLLRTLLERVVGVTKRRWSEMIVDERRSRTLLEDVMEKEWGVIIQLAERWRGGGGDGGASGAASSLPEQSDEWGAGSGSTSGFQHQAALQETVALLRRRNRELEARLADVDPAAMPQLRERLAVAEATVLELRAELQTVHSVQAAAFPAAEALRRQGTHPQLPPICAPTTGTSSPAVAAARASVSVLDVGAVHKQRQGTGQGETHEVLLSESLRSLVTWECNTRADCEGAKRASLSALAEACASPRGGSGRPRQGAEAASPVGALDLAAAAHFRGVADCGSPRCSSIEEQVRMEALGREDRQFAQRQSLRALSKLRTPEVESIVPEKDAGAVSPMLEPLEPLPGLGTGGAS